MKLRWRRRRRDGLVKSRRGLRRDLWVGWRPNGIGEQKPNHYGAIVHTIWDNRRELPYAMRILRKGVCDGCALGVAGFHDWTISGVHLCTTRLRPVFRLQHHAGVRSAHLADCSHAGATLGNGGLARARAARAPDGPPQG